MELRYQQLSIVANADEAGEQAVELSSVPAASQRAGHGLRPQRSERAWTRRRIEESGCLISQGACGNVQIHVRVDGRDVTNPIAVFHPEIAKPADRLPTQQGCGELASSAPQLLFANLAVASGLLGAFYSWRQDKLDYEEAYFDVLTGRTVPVKRMVCSPKQDRKRAARAGGTKKKAIA